MLDTESFWKDVLEQNAEELKGYFCENAYVNWHNTNEHFTAGTGLCPFTSRHLYVQRAVR